MRKTIALQAVKTGQEYQAILEPDETPCVIGRTGAHINIRDTRCSRRHAILYTDSRGDLWIKDLGSRNGTFVNNRRVATEKLGEGDLVRIGNTWLEIGPECEPQSESRPPKLKTRSTSLEMEHMAEGSLSLDLDTESDLARALVRQRSRGSLR